MDNLPLPRSRANWLIAIFLAMIVFVIYYLVIYPETRQKYNDQFYNITYFYNPPQECETEESQHLSLNIRIPKYLLNSGPVWLYYALDNKTPCTISTAVFYIDIGIATEATEDLGESIIPPVYYGADTYIPKLVFTDVHSGSSISGRVQLIAQGNSRILGVILEEAQFLSDENHRIISFSEELGISNEEIGVLDVCPSEALKQPILEITLLPPWANGVLLGLVLIACYLAEKKEGSGGKDDYLYKVKPLEYTEKFLQALMILLILVIPVVSFVWGFWGFLFFTSNAFIVYLTLYIISTRIPILRKTKDRSKVVLFLSALGIVIFGIGLTIYGLREPDSFDWKFLWSHIVIFGTLIIIPPISYIIYYKSNEAPGNPTPEKSLGKQTEEGHGQTKASIPGEYFIAWISLLDIAGGSWVWGVDVFSANIYWFVIVICGIGILTIVLQMLCLEIGNLVKSRCTDRSEETIITQNQEHPASPNNSEETEDSTSQDNSQKSSQPVSVGVNANQDKITVAGHKTPAGKPPQQKRTR